MAHHALEGRAGVGQVLAGVKVIRMLGKVLADHGCEGQAQVGVDVDFAHGHPGSLAQHGLRHPLGAVQLAAELVDHFHILGDDAGGTVQHDGESREPALHLLQNVKAQLGLALELEGAMAGANGNGQGIAACALHKLLHLFGSGIGGILSRHLDVILNAGKAPQFRFHSDIPVMGIFNHLAGEGDVLFKGQMGSVDHDGGEATVNHAFAGFKVGAVVQVHHDVQIAGLHRRLNQLHQVGVVGILAGAG